MKTYPYLCSVNNQNINIMKTINLRDYNGLVSELDAEYFPDVKYYHDSPKTQKIHYNCELFNNGCIGIDKLVSRLSKLTEETEVVLYEIVRKYYN